MGKLAEAIRMCVQTTLDIQPTRFLKLEFKHLIFCNADTRIGDTAVLQVAGGRSEFDADGDESTQFIRPRLSSHLEISMHYCGFGWD